MQDETNIITLDGVTASGKGTVGHLLSERLGYKYINTGAMYRLAAHLALENKLPLLHTPELIELARNIDIEFDGKKIIHQGVDIWPIIQSQHHGQSASMISHIKELREAINHNLLHHHVSKGPVVVDARDAAVVYPHAKLKIFLTADDQVRAERRYQDELRNNTGKTFDQVLDEIRLRDHRDINREHGKLEAAPDALVIDTTHLTPEQVVEQILHTLKSRS